MPPTKKTLTTPVEVLESRITALEERLSRMSNSKIITVPSYDAANLPAQSVEGQVAIMDGDGGGGGGNDSRLYISNQLIDGDSTSIIFEDFPTENLTNIQLYWRLTSATGDPLPIYMLYNGDGFGSSDNYIWNLSVPNQKLSIASSYGSADFAADQAALIGLTYDEGVGSIIIPNPGDADNFAVCYGLYSGYGSYIHGSDIDVFNVGGMWNGDGGSDPKRVERIEILLDGVDLRDGGYITLTGLLPD